MKDNICRVDQNDRENADKPYWKRAYVIVVRIGSALDPPILETQFITIGKKKKNFNEHLAASW